MQAIGVTHPQLVTVSPRDTVIRAALLMLDHRISGLPVVEDDGRLVGIITEGDLLHRIENNTDRSHSRVGRMFTRPDRLAAEFTKSAGRQIKDVMTLEPVIVAESAELADIADLFDRHKIKRVPVMRDGRLVGIVTRADLLRALVGSGSVRAGDLSVAKFHTTTMT